MLLQSSHRGLLSRESSTNQLLPATSRRLLPEADRWMQQRLLRQMLSCEVCLLRPEMLQEGRLLPL